MRTLIVYESYFGCTQEIAEALADEFRRVGATTLTPVETARHHPVGAYDLVVVGGPTQARGLSRTDTRRAVLSRAAMHHRKTRVDPRISIGLREWTAATQKPDRRATLVAPPEQSVPQLPESRPSRLTGRLDPAP